MNTTIIQRFFIFALLICLFNNTNAQIITTIAGTSAGGYDGDGQLATKARLNYPNGLFVTKEGDVLIAETGNQLIRKVNYATGIISTIVGSGWIGNFTDGDEPLKAKLKYPSGVILDATGNMILLAKYSLIKVTKSPETVKYIRIKEVNTNGNSITNKNLSAMAEDAKGNLYYTDTDNNRIRKTTIETGITTTIAGTGKAGYMGDGDSAKNAELNNPTGICLDAAGNIYFADNGNNVIRKISIATGKITTVAGNGTAGFSGDGALAKNAQFFKPMGVAINKLGDLYITDNRNNRIRMVNAATGIITTIAGTGNPDFSGDGGDPKNASMFGPTGIFIDSKGNIYFTDTNNYRVRKITLTK